MIRLSRELLSSVVALAVLGGILSGLVAIVVGAGTGPAWWRDGTDSARYEVIVHLAGPPERLAHALALWSRQPSARLMSTRVDPACWEAGGRGEPCRSGVRNTVDEALLVRRHVLREGVRKVLIVTSRYHLPRTRLIFATVFVGTGVELGFDAPASGDGGRRRLLGDLLKTPTSLAGAALGRCCPGTYEAAVGWMQ